MSRRWHWRRLPPVFGLSLATTSALFLFHLVLLRAVLMPDQPFVRSMRFAGGFFVADYLALSLQLLLITAPLLAEARRSQLVIGWLAVWPFVRLAQMMAIFDSGQYVTADVLAHAGLIWMLLTPATVLALFAAVAGGLGAAIGFRAWARRRPPVPTRSWLAAALLPALLSGAVWLDVGFGRHRELVDRYAVDTRAVEWTLVTALRDFAFGDPESRASFTPTGVDFERWRELGLHYRADEHYPLMRDTIFETPAPAVRKGQRPRQLVLLLFESLSHDLLREELTPNLLRFREQSSFATQYFNHTTPTILGIRGQLCSFYPLSSYSDWDRVRLHQRTRLRCLPRILADEGFHTVYFHHGMPTDTNVGPQMSDFGVSEQHYRFDIIRNWLPDGRTCDRRDLTDHEMMRALIAYLRRHEASEAPLFLAASTVDLHVPFAIPPDLPEAASGESNPVAAILRSTDDAFNEFWEYWRNSPWASRAILVLTADHAIFPNPEVAAIDPALVSEDRSYFRPITFAVSAPRLELPSRFDTPTNSADLAPTLAHLLDVNAPNAFMGRSLFEPMQRRRFVGTQREMGFIFDLEAGAGRQFRADAADCERAPESERCSYWRWSLYQRQLARQNRLWADVQ